MVEQQLHLAATIFMAHQTGRKDPGVIYHQDVALVQPLRQVQKVPVNDPASIPRQHQQTGGIPLLQRVLGHQLRRQNVIVVFNQGHGDEICLDNFL